MVGVIIASLEHVEEGTLEMEEAGVMRDILPITGQDPAIMADQRYGQVEDVLLLGLMLHLTPLHMVVAHIVEEGHVLPATVEAVMVAATTATDNP